MSHKKWAYCAACPDGKIFNSDEIPRGWVDTPAKLRKTTKKKVSKKRAVK